MPPLPRFWEDRKAPPLVDPEPDGNFVPVLRHLGSTGPLRHLLWLKMGTSTTNDQKLHLGLDLTVPEVIDLQV